MRKRGGFNFELRNQDMDFDNNKNVKIANVVMTLIFCFIMHKSSIILLQQLKNTMTLKLLIKILAPSLSWKINLNMQFQ